MTDPQVPLSLVPKQPRSQLPEEIDPFAAKLDAEAKVWVEALERDFPGWPIQFHYAVLSNYKRHGKEFFTPDNIEALVEKYKDEPRPVSVQPDLKLERLESADAAKYFPPEESSQDAASAGPALEAHEPAAE